MNMSKPYLTQTQTKGLNQHIHTLQQERVTLQLPSSSHCTLMTMEDSAVRYPANTHAERSFWSRWKRIYSLLMFTRHTVATSCKVSCVITACDLGAVISINKTCVSEILCAGETEMIFDASWHHSNEIRLIGLVKKKTTSPKKPYRTSLFLQLKPSYPPRLDP